MKHRENKVDWIQSFYDSAADRWGTSWYNGENLQGRLKVIQHFGIHLISVYWNQGRVLEKPSPISVIKDIL